MIDHRVDINSLNPETGTSPLMLAAALGYHRICNILIDAGADMNASDHAGNTPLHLAARGYGEQKPVIETLIQRGAKIDAKNDDGFTPAMLAKDSANSECFKVLNSQPTIAANAPAYEQAQPVKEEPSEQNVFSFT
jgi:ankyrin repeat protein